MRWQDKSNRFESLIEVVAESGCRRSSLVMRLTKPDGIYIAAYLQIFSLSCGYPESVLLSAEEPPSENAE